MLKLVIPSEELFNEETQEFIREPSLTLCLEHSLVSLSKWEAKFEKPFLSDQTKTDEEIHAYVKAMIISGEYPENILTRLTPEHFQAINNHIEAKMTATWFNEPKTTKPTTEIITAELLYYWMITFNIPIEFQYWHLNRLLTLLKVFSLKNAPAKKLSRREILTRNRELNEQRKAQFKTNG